MPQKSILKRRKSLHQKVANLFISIDVDPPLVVAALGGRVSYYHDRYGLEADCDHRTQYGYKREDCVMVVHGSRDLTISEMACIAKALGKTAAYFLDENFTLPTIPSTSPTSIFYAGEPNKALEKFALQLIEMLENADEILGAKARFMIQASSSPKLY